MNFNQLNYFVKVIENGSISKAANALYITQPALSISMHSLEKELGFVLYNKTKKGIEPTSEGLTFYEDAKNILTYIDKWEEMRMALKSKISVVSMGIVNALYFSLSDEILLRCCESYQNIGIALKYGTWDDLNEAFENGDIRILINSCPKSEIKNIYKNSDKIGYKVKFFSKDKYYAYLNKNDELGRTENISLERIKDYTMVRYLTHNKTYSDFSDVYSGDESVYFKNLNHILLYVSRNLHCYTLLPGIIERYSLVNWPEEIVRKPLVENASDNELYYYVQYPGDQDIVHNETQIVSLLFKVFSDLFGRFDEI